MKTLNQVPKERTNLMSFPGDENFKNKYQDQEKKIYKTHPDYKAHEQASDEKCMICDLGI